MSLGPLSWRNRFYPKIWFVGGVFLLFVSAILWIWLQLAARVTKETSFANADAVPKAATVDQFPADLGSLTDIVPVLNITKVADKQDSSHSPEFKAAAFIGQHESDWTLQIMNVSQESVITDFLAKRSDRDRFQYFHYHKDDKNDSYVLTYGVFTTIETAMGALQTMDFGLPDSVKAFPERFSTYKPFVSDSEDVAGDLTTLQRQVKLRPVALPPPDAIEEKLAEISAQSASTNASASSQSAMPSGVDGFSGQPDAPPADDTQASPTSPSPKATHDVPAPTAVQDPFN